ncbi:MAG: LytR/AlgR family response regulator transcription factor, partial [Gammaproteobacteria bacterium]
MSIRAVIIDDEPYARERLRELCALEPDLAVVGEASHGLEAVQQVEAVKPDLLLLDVQMRGANGFGVLQRLKTQRPLVVFVTAYDQYALEAWACDSGDDILDPVDRDRVQQAMGRGG